jgi:HEXXH motif-containing protein
VDARPWYPGLAACLVREFERQLHGDGWTYETYGTHRWMTGDVRAALIPVGVISAGFDSFTIEILPAETRRALNDVPIAEKPAPDVADRLQAAITVIAQVDGLAGAIGCLVQSCHVLAAEHGYDVSHSTPALPLSIFVSVPGADEPHAVLRLAESVIHEAMHLQLTFIESMVPLVRPTGATAFSPWKQSDRPVQGLVHGLYVFAVIYEALAEFADAVPGSREYAETRRAEIASEVSGMGDARHSLTSDGIALWDQLMSRVGTRG